MNRVPDAILKNANDAAVYVLYAYLAHITAPAEKSTLRSVVEDLELNLKTQTTYAWNGRDIYRLSILRNAVKTNAFLANATIGDLTVSRNGLTACSLTDPDNHIFVVFRGTGKGEWIDTGEGLSGIPEENTYRTYGENGTELSRKTVTQDHATDQQVEALNWFCRVAAKNRWTTDTGITLAGHSKGGNKAQFIAMHSDLAKYCYSFDGPGFSPEALEELKRQCGENFEARRQTIHSFSADNDYVNVLGVRLVPESQNYYFESRLGFHYLEAMLDVNGRFHAQCEQGDLSRYVESVSEKLTNLEPRIRQYATLGVMNIFQKFLGKGTPVNADRVSIEQTVVGMGIAVDLLLRGLTES